MKARLVDLIGSSGIKNATSAQPKNLACAPPFRSFGGVAGDETKLGQQICGSVALGFPRTLKSSWLENHTLN